MPNSKYPDIPTPKELQEMGLDEKAADNLYHKLLMRRKKALARANKPMPAKDLANKKRTEKLMANRLVTVDLKLKHNVNGEIYGPGKVQLPYNVACDLQHTEGLAIEDEYRFYGSRGQIITGQVGGRYSSAQWHGVKVVPVEIFDSSLGRQKPVDPRTGKDSDFFGE